VTLAKGISAKMRVASLPAQPKLLSMIEKPHELVRRRPQGLPPQNFESKCAHYPSSKRGVGPGARRSRLEGHEWWSSQPLRLAGADRPPRAF